jgi:hypothetical protein
VKTRNCKYCEGTFKSDLTSQMYCDPQCSKKGSRMISQERRQALRAAEPPRWEEKTCASCSATFRFKLRRGRKPSYCGACAGKLTTKKVRACDRSA